MSLEIGSKAPAFSAEVNGGQKFKLSDNLGKWLVLYFYPQDDTETCTKQACDFRDNMERITSVGANVVGVSPDGVKSHDKFTSKYDLNFQLIADESKEICNLYGVIGEKSMFGKKYMGVIRTSYIIDPKGEIKMVYNNVQIKGHIDKIIADLETLQS
ncbi:MAG: thioredoxin-dependent thiol peroxidase [Ignavibacteriae bacterium HGW-Ignavibacteriae-1]|jgi:peroxiredoxin Q/BCP|nr:MAG: thioredoxin-dependent thiol peroxidase [Ignavibacteriae bacterium HGW-Ignavibacteriae-1]